MELTETGLAVYNRTYSRTLPDGSRESWADTVTRVVDGNLGLIPDTHHLDTERDDLIEMMTDFKIIPAGRHLWASGVKGRQYLFNCWVSHWDTKITDHFEFTFLRLMEGGGVGSNYSNSYLAQYPEISGHEVARGGEVVVDSPYYVHIVCDPEHPDYSVMADAGLLSTEYVADWDGAYEVEDSREGWARALVDLLETYYRPTRNVRRVFDVSRVRHAGERLKTFGGHASGPAPLATMLHEVAEVMNSRIGQRLDGIGAMEIDHAIATCVVSGGNRRSARMSIMHWDDPQVFDFLRIKETSGKHWTTNISVEVDQQFWNRQVEGYPPTDNGVHASKVLDAIAEGMLSNGEPGIWNSTTNNIGEPNRVVACNPCGEIGLTPSEPCNLGHINLAAFVDPATGVYDSAELAYAHELMTRFLIRATYADVNDPKSRAVLDRNRRIGVGHLGVASFLALTGTRYADAPTTGWFVHLLSSLALEVTDAAIAYAHDLRIPVPVKTRTVAPTGTIAKMPGVSEGIHPIFARYFLRRIRFSDVDTNQRETVEDYRSRGYAVEPCRYAPNTTVVTIPTKDTLVAAVEALGLDPDDIVQSADELGVGSMLAMQELYQRLWADNAVSYTVNLNPESVTAHTLARTLATYGPSLKGTTVFPTQSHEQAPYEQISADDFALYEYGREIGDGVDESCSTGACPVR